ncbi:MAG: PQQ-binding-like beta-propeller repeat protein [Gemmatimonadota bacterium]
MRCARFVVRVVTGCILAGGVGCTADPLPTTAPAAATILAKPSADTQFGSAADDAAHAMASGKAGVAMAGTTAGTLAGQSSAGGTDAFVRLTDKRGVELWAQQFGTGADDAAFAVGVDRAGIYVGVTSAGALGGITNLGASDGSVRALDAAGAIRWQTRIASAGADTVFGLTVDRGAVYVTGVLRGPTEGTTVSDADGFVVKLDAQTGQILWMTRFAGTTNGDDAARGVTADGDALFVAVTYTGGVIGAGPGAEDAYLVRLDATTGAYVWFSTIATPMADVAHAVSQVGSTAFLTGSRADDAFVAAFSAATGQLSWQTTLVSAGSDVATVVGGDRSLVYVGGSTTGAFIGFSNVGGSDVFHATLDAATGAVTLLEQIATASNESALGAWLDGAVWHMVGSTGGALAGVALGGTDAFWLQRATR